MGFVPISSPSTAVAKFVWPTGWLGLLGYHLGLALADSPHLRWSGGGPVPLWGTLLLVFLLALGVWGTYRVSLPLKKVRLAEGRLYASNYRREIWISWNEVRRVVVHSTFGYRRTPLVELDLKECGPFGRRISLLPRSAEALAKLEQSIPAELQIPWEYRAA